MAIQGYADSWKGCGNGASFSIVELPVVDSLWEDPSINIGFVDCGVSRLADGVMLVF